MPKYEICADEAWTHENDPDNRYWCFFGGLLGLTSDMDRLETSLRHILLRFGHTREVKWQSVSDHCELLYRELIDEVFLHVRQYDLKYRQTFMDRYFVHATSPSDPTPSKIDTQFKVYYQFIKHSFGLKYLPESSEAIELSVLLDRHSSQDHKSSLQSFVEKLPSLIGRTDIEIKLSFVSSKRYVRLQMCDLLMGAAGSHGNRKHKKRIAGQRGMTPKQKCRLNISTYIYNSFRRLDAESRGSRAFNWFETTGHSGSLNNRYAHKIRIWKFKPNNIAHLDEGWLSKNMGPQWTYQGPKLVTPKT